MKIRYVLPILCSAALTPGCSMLPSGIGQYGLPAQPVVKPLPEPGNRDVARLHYQLGRFYQAQSNPEYALAAYAQALSLDASLHEARNGMGVIYAGQGRYDAAVDQFQQALRLAPQAAHIHSNLGYALVLHGQYAQAATAFDKATQLDPQNEKAWNNLGEAYARSGAPDKAREARARGLALRAPTAAPLEQAPAAPVAPAVTAPPVPVAALPVSRTPPHVRPAPGLTLPPESRAAFGLRLNPPQSREAGGGVTLVNLSPSVWELRAAPARPTTQASPAGARSRSDVESLAVMKTLRLEVANGNGTEGMARRVAQRLREAGLQPVRLTNQKPWQRATEVQFRTGHAAEAERLAQLLQSKAIVVRNDALRSDIRLRLVLGQDVRDEQALLRPETPAMLAAVQAR